MRKLGTNWEEIDKKLGTNVADGRCPPTPSLPSSPSNNPFLNPLANMPPTSLSIEGAGSDIIRQTFQTPLPPHHPPPLFIKGLEISKG